MPQDAQYDPSTTPGALPTGAATSAKQDATNTALGGITDASADGDAASGSIIARLRYLAKAFAAVIAGSSKVAVMNSDGTTVGNVAITEVAGTANGAGQFDVTAINVSQFKSISLHRTGTYNLTSTFEVSNDNVNWVACPMQNVASVPLAANSSVAGAGNGMFAINVNFKWFRSRISAWTSGTVNTVLLLSPLSAQMPTLPVNAFQSGGWNFNSNSDYPASATPITAASGNVSNASAVATLAKVAAKTTYITGFEVTSSGATAASVVTVTVTGTVTGTLSYTLAVVAGATLPNGNMLVQFAKPIPSSAVNTDIVVTVPALGAGNTNATVVAHGYVL